MNNEHNDNISTMLEAYSSKYKHVFINSLSICFCLQLMKLRISSQLTKMLAAFHSSNFIRQQTQRALIQMRSYQCKTLDSPPTFATSITWVGIQKKALRYT